METKQEQKESWLRVYKAVKAFYKALKKKP